MAKLNRVAKAEKQPAENATPLPLIPTSGKKASKNDSPLEKEIRRFNRLVKQLHELEADAARQQAYDEEYDRLYQQQLLPEMARLAQVRYRYVLQAHQLFQKEKFTKTEEKHFIRWVNDMLAEVAEFIPEARELARTYLNRSFELMNKKEKEQFNSFLEGEGVRVEKGKAFDVEDLWEKKVSELEEEFFQQHTDSFHQQKDAQRQLKRESLEQTDITSLYKELVKQLHPDLEQDETRRHEKEHLMKDLSEARSRHDLYAMLLIKAKARKFMGDAAAQTHTYSLEQLKRYNKELKKKLDEHMNRFKADIFNNLAMALGGFEGPNRSTGFSKFDNAAKDIERELKQIKKEIKDTEKELKQLQTPTDLKAFIAIIREYGKGRY